MRTVRKSCATFAWFICNSLVIGPLKNSVRSWKAQNMRLRLKKIYEQLCKNYAGFMCKYAYYMHKVHKPQLTEHLKSWSTLNSRKVTYAKSIDRLLRTSTIERKTHETLMNDIYYECTQMTKFGICSNSTKLLSD